MKMADDNNMSDWIAAVAQIALFTMCTSDDQMLTAKITFISTSYYPIRPYFSRHMQI